MTRTFAILIFVGLCPFLSVAQTANQLEEGVRIYNTLQDTLDSPGIKTSLLIRLADQSEALLKKVALNGSAEEVRAAKYFLANLTLIRAETYYKGTKSEQELTQPTLLSVESEFDRFSPEEFPIRYAYFGKNFKIEYANFIYVRMKYYAEMAEMFVGEDAAKVKKYARKALDINAPNSEYLQYLLYYFLNNETSPANADKIEYAQQFITLYSKLGTDDRKTFNDARSGLVYMKKNAAILLDPRYTDWDKTGALSLARAKELAATHETDSLACRFYDQAVAKGAPVYDSEKIEVLDFYAAKGFMTSGVKLCDKMLTTQSATYCEGYDQLAKYYNLFGDALKAKSMKQSAEKCRSKAQQEAAAEAKRREKEARRANRNHGYLGAYVLRIAQRPQYIDWGGTLDIPAGRTLFEFSYMKARNDQDYLLMERLSDKPGLSDFDNPHWDGFYAHFGFKRLEKSYDKSKSYRGMLFTYNQRNYQPQSTFVIEKATQLQSTSEILYQPKMTTYGVMFNFGQLALGKPFGADFYMGVGPTYSLFQLNNDTYSHTDYDFSNPFIQHRKEQFWGFQIRIGMTLGVRL